jgi:precorrin-2 methylase
LKDNDDENYATNFALSGATNKMMDYDVERKIAEISLTKKESFLPIELDSTIAELQREKQELEQLIAQEESSLEKELDASHQVCFICLVGGQW